MTADATAAPSGAQPSNVSPTDPVRMIMASPVATLDAGSSMLDVAAELAADEVGAVLVTGAGPLGVLTERDVLNLVGTGADLGAAQAADVMTTDVIWAGPDETIAAIGERMLEAGVRHLPVGDGRDAVGIVSLRDVAVVLLTAR